MPETNIASTTYSDLTNAMVSYSVDHQITDGATGDQETRWQMTKWPQYLGYYKTIPELQTAIDAKAIWTMGGGFEADEETTLLLSSMTGNGKDNFNSILENCIRTYTIGGDCFVEVIRDENDMLINLKPLDPSTIAVVQNRSGRVVRYEQTDKHRKNKKHFKPTEILHLSRKRLADEMHGISIIDSVEWIIKARNEAMNDWKTVLHRNVSPLQIHYVDSDDVDKVAAYKAKADLARAGGENLYVPKGTVEVEVVQSQLNQAASPLAWIEQLNNYFFQAVNVPQIVIGNSKEFTDASGKIVYLAFEQSVKAEQLYVEEELLSQLNIEIKLTFPASLQNDVITSRDKEAGMQASTPNDVLAEMEGRK